METDSEAIEYHRGDYVYIVETIGYRFHYSAAIVLDVTKRGSVRVQHLDNTTVSMDATGTSSSHRYRVTIEPESGLPVRGALVELFRSTKGGVPKKGDSTLEGVVSLEGLKDKIFQYDAYY